MFHTSNLSLLLLIFAVHLKFIGSLSVTEFLTLTSSQKNKLDEFRTLVTPHLPHEYMKKDIYLIRWLRDRSFDVAAAQKRLLAHIQWRSDNQIDSILTDWADFDHEYRIYIEGCDKDGKPVISMFPGDWDIRRASLSGKIQRFMRYLVKLFEEALVTVRAMQESGQNVTQATIICDLAEFSVITHACPSCIALYIQLGTIYENNYPGLAHRLIGINVPQVALTLWDLFKHLLDPQTAQVLHVYSRDRRSWERALVNEIDRDQLPKRFGGFKNESLDLVEYRELNKVFTCT